MTSTQGATPRQSPRSPALNVAPKHYDQIVKLMMIGDSGVGKSCLLFRFACGSFTNHQRLTDGIDFRHKTIDSDGRSVKLQVWDTAGQERFHTITQQYYRKAQGIVLVYDITDEESFANIRKWAAQIAAHSEEGTDRVLVGNKLDLEPRVVSTARGQAVADEYGIPFFETSAQSGQGVDEAFAALASNVCKRVSAQTRDATHNNPNGGLVTLNRSEFDAHRR